MAGAPSELSPIKSRKAGYQFRIGVSALDCTGCAVCAETCPVHCLEMTPLEPEYEANKNNIAFLREKVNTKPELGDKKNVLGMGMQPPYFEFPGACGGCGETPLVRLVSQLFGDRMVIAAATGCELFTLSFFHLFFLHFVINSSLTHAQSFEQVIPFGVQASQLYLIAPTRREKGRPGITPCLKMVLNWDTA